MRVTSIIDAVISFYDKDLSNNRHKQACAWGWPNSRAEQGITWHSARLLARAHAR